MEFTLIEKNGNIYRKNINKTGNCIHYPELKCACCNSECDHNCSIDEEFEELLMDEF